MMHPGRGDEPGILGAMRRTMTGFHRDDAGDWVAELSCLHQQHVRHQPPFWEAAWIEDDRERAGRVGQPLDCPLCDRAELPENLVPARTTATWDASSVPGALLRAHRVAPCTWGLLEVEAGAVRFTAATDPPIDLVVTADRAQPIPPEVDHQVEPGDGARFHLTFLVRPAELVDEGGEAPCFAHLVEPDEPR
jgi:tellurite methyltransferase